MKHWLQRLKWIFVPKTYYFTVYPLGDDSKEVHLRHIIAHICGEGRVVTNALVEILTAEIDSSVSDSVQLTIQDQQQAAELRTYLACADISHTEEVS